MNSNSMEYVQKRHSSFNSRMGSSPSEVLLKIFLKVVFWVNVMNEQLQTNNLISWRFLIQKPIRVVLK